MVSGTQRRIKSGTIMLKIVMLTLLTACSAKAPVIVPPPPTAHQVNLSWSFPEEFTGFNVYRSTDNVTFTRIVVITGPQNTYQDNNVVSETTYYYKTKTMCNVCSPSSSDYSNTVQIKVP